MSKVEETKEMITIHRSYLYTMKESAEKWKEPAMVLTDNMIQDYEKLYTLIKEVESEQEVLQKKADAYDEIMNAATDRNNLEESIALKLKEFIESDWDFYDESEIEQGSIEYAQKIVELFEQSKPVEIPRWLADWIEMKRAEQLYSDNTLFKVIVLKCRNQSFEKEWIRYIENNMPVVARAILDGYTAKQEPVVHALKLDTLYFDDVESGVKTFEIRKNDRLYRVGDILSLGEYNPNSRSYTGRECRVQVIYITDYAQQDNYVVLGVEPVEGGTGMTNK
ncbi:DUF3850 domain-containing protein [Enterococcus sp. BWR-S5]|uniref:DUF3850 domain-containing protein n=1 Tax=Enterococcus sp. BWR-S5 TaxID=2787714 RepID=UPI001922DE25|nr:DUF3850 domain-containing protein [Enterococcus sp. BWR-S5]MBL1226590.1 DUF3850 domain-containing protein [Enterococcus sp. BWR-S5]